MSDYTMYVDESGDPGIYRVMFKSTGFEEPVKFQNMRQRIGDGNPVKQLVLQLVDFFAHATWRRNTSSRHIQKRWELIKVKYYKLDEAPDERGNVEI